MQAQSNFGACGLFKAIIGRPDGTTRVAADWQPNLITDAGLKSFAGESSGSFYDRDAKMQVGTGSGTPSVTDTALFNQVALQSRRYSYDNQGALTKSHTTVSPYYKSMTVTWVFGKGAAAGNLTELGVESDYPFALLSHALIKDSAGNPTSITVATDEVLTVVYELRFYLLDTTDQVGTVTLDGTSTSFTLRPSRVDQGDFKFYGLISKAFNFLIFYDSSATLGPITGGPSGSNISDYLYSLTLTAVSLSAGVASQSGTFTVASTKFNNLGSSVAAMALRNGLVSNSFLAIQIAFDPPFAKDGTKEFTFTLEATWERYTP